jgi:two-component system nitrogen regulation sensor histidine kinase NtrY
MKGLGFRGRLFAYLLAFALVPSVLLLLGWGAMTRSALPLVGATAAWEDVSSSGQRAIAGARANPTSEATRAALDTHDVRLREGLLRSKQTGFLVRQGGRVAGGIILILIVGLGLLAARVAGHLSRNMSRPLQELVEWTDLIARGEALPSGPPPRGAPEFQLLRHRMQRMAHQLLLGRQRALEAERAAALRESARQVAHELKNPLTPIRLAVARLKRHATPEIAEAVEVLEVESARLDTMARSFSQFGRLPEGPRAPIDLGELARYAARASSAPGIAIEVEVAADTPMVDGHYDAVSRALANVVINAVDACDTRGRVTLSVGPCSLNGHPAVEVVVRDTGRGIEPDRLPHVFEPYVTTKPGGTGLGLAIVRQIVLAHDGQVDATSEVGAGTSIRMVLPADPTSRPAQAVSGVSLTLSG